MFKNPFWKTLGLKRLQALVGSAVAYSDSANYTAFLTEAADGEIGFFNNATGALLTTAIASTTKFFVALMRGGKVYKTTPVLGSEITKIKTAYSAPAKHVIDISLGTKATLTVQNLVFTARSGGTGGNSLTVTFVDPAGNNAALSVAIAGNDITVNLATDGASAPTSTAAQVLAALQASANIMAKVTVVGTGDMTTVQAGAAQASLAGGAEATAPVAGNAYSIEILDLTTATQPFPTYMYSYIAVAGDTIATIVAKIAAMINDTTSVDNKFRDLIVTATTGTDLVTVTAINYGTTFRILLRDTMATAASTNIVTKAKWGSGYPDQVKYLEAAGDIFYGVTTNYPENHAIPEEFGKPNSLVLSTNTYNMYSFSRIAQEKSRTPHNIWMNEEVFALAVPSNGTNPSSTIDTLLGL